MGRGVKIVLAAVFTLLAATPSFSQFRPCPYFSAGWSKQFAGSAITSVLYDQQTLLMYIIFQSVNASVFANVPLGVMQGFMNTQDPVGYYSSFVLPSYHALLLSQTNNCPMLFEDGVTYIWSD